MKGPRDLKRYMAVLRRLSKKANGVIPGSWMDDLNLFKLERCKKWRKQNRRSRDGYLHKDNDD